MARICAAIAPAPSPALDVRDAVQAVLVDGSYAPAVAQSIILRAFGGAAGASEAASLARLYMEEPRQLGNVAPAVVTELVAEVGLAEAAHRPVTPPVRAAIATMRLPALRRTRIRRQSPSIVAGG